MSGSLQSPCDNLPSGNYHGRVIEKSEKSNQIIVLIKDRLFRLIMEETVKLPIGSLISFKVNLDKKLEKIKIKNSTSNFEANGDIFRWIKLTKKPSRMEFLKTRHQIIRGIRKWFDQQNFIETETPLLVSAPSPEAQLFPVKTEKGYLITSPEYQMKRLLVGGFDKIFQITRCFRDAENSPQHNPEFTMLEWYRTYQPLEKLMTDIEQFVLHLSDSVKSNLLSKKIPLPPWPRKSVSALFKKHIGIKLDGSETSYELRKKAELSGHEKLFHDLPDSSKLTDSLAYEQTFFRLWNYIQNRFSQSTPVFVFDWPLPLASLARKNPMRKEFAERVELYVNCMELANGFAELTEPIEQRRRFEQDLKNRISEERETVPLDKKLLKSLEQGLPECSGMALGIDRLIMWLCGTDNIQDVICFTEDEV
jgi:lysyl-tRNA synthetase class 2